MRKTVVYMLVAVLLVSVASVFIEFPKVKASTTLTFNTSSSDGMILHYSSSYSSARNSATGTVYDTSNTITVGQQYSTPNYYVYRGFLFFDTSSLPDSATVDSVILSLRVANDYSTTDFNVTIQNGQPTYPHDPLEAGDYYYSSYEGVGGSRSTSDGLSAGNYWNITLNSDGESWVSKTGWTKLCLRSQEDIDSSAPSNSEMVAFGHQESGYVAKLYVTYSVAEEDYYSYTLYGPFDEETGYVVDENVTVNAWSKEGGGYESFTLDESYIYNVSTLVRNFEFVFEDNSTREYWVDPSESNSSTIYVFHGNVSGTIATYTVSFTDTTGVLSDYPYVTCKRYVNGSLYTVEKRKVDRENKIIVNMIPYRTYELFIGAETAYSFGEVTFGASSTITLTIKSLMFPENVIMGYRYVRCYANRDMSTGVVYAYYQDLEENTANVSISIYYQSNDTYVTGSVQYVNVWSYTLSTLDNATDYYLEMVIYHNDFGWMNYKQVLPRLYTDDTPWDLSALGGDDLPFNPAHLIPTFIIIAVAASFSALNTPIGLFSTAVVAIIIAYLGWLPLNAEVLVFAFALVIVFAIAILRRRTYS